MQNFAISSKEIATGLVGWLVLSFILFGFSYPNVLMLTLLLVIMPCVLVSLGVCILPMHMESVF